MLSIKPGVAEGQTSTFSQRTDVLKRVFIRIFGVQRFVSGKINGLRGFRDGHVLRPAAAQMHLDASLLLIIQGPMGKGRHMKIGPEFAVHTVQHIEIKGGSYPLCIVICRQQERGRFFQVNTQQEDILRPHQRCRTLQEVKALCAGKIAEIGAQKRQGFFLQAQGPNDPRVASKVSVDGMD